MCLIHIDKLRLLLGEVDSATGQMTAAYTWGANGLVSQRLASGSYWFHFGPQGETRQLTNAAGAVTDSYFYAPSGAPIASTGTTPNPFRYGGQWGYYADGDLYLCGVRWFSAYLGRWLSRDPIGYESGPNLYEYCANDPISYIDPMGLDWVRNLSNFASGIADTATFGATKIARKELSDLFRVPDANGQVDYDSGTYFAGEVAGIAGTSLAGGYGGWLAGGTKGAGKEFSHWIPDRFLKRFKPCVRKTFGKSKFNGNYVPRKRHYKHDYWRRLRDSGDLGRKYNPIFQQFDRVPRVYYGTGAGFAYGYGHHKLADEK